MKLFLTEDKNILETIVDIKYNHFNRHLQKVVELIEEKKLELEAIHRGEIYFVEVTEVYYIEAVDGLTFLYTQTDIFESKEKLYSIENKLDQTSFIRINKNSILNMDYLKSVSPLPNYRMEATLANDEKLIINRHYMKRVKTYLNI